MKREVIHKDLVCWRIHTPALLKEILNNSQCAILRIPIKMFGDLLSQVGDRASQLNDPELNALMMKLTIYQVADPYTAEYDSSVVDQVIKLGAREKRKRIRSRSS